MKAKELAEKWALEAVPKDEYADRYPTDYYPTELREIVKRAHQAGWYAALEEHMTNETVQDLEKWWATEPFGFDNPDTYAGILELLQRAEKRGWDAALRSSREENRT